MCIVSVAVFILPFHLWHSVRHFVVAMQFEFLFLDSPINTGKHKFDACEKKVFIFIFPNILFMISVKICITHFSKSLSHFMKSINHGNTSAYKKAHFKLMPDKRRGKKRITQNQTAPVKVAPSVAPLVMKSPKQSMRYE